MPRLRSLSRGLAASLAVCAGATALAAPAHADDGVVSGVAGPADAAVTAAAQAGEAVVSGSAATLLAPAGAATDCTTAAMSQPFAGVGDDRHYVLAPGGDFETGAAGWTLGAGARVVATTEHDGSAGSALALGAGASAVSPPVCVDLDYPTARLWSRGTAGGGVTVLVSYLDGGRVDRTRLAGRVATTTAWTPSADLDVQPDTTGAAAGWRRATFTFVGASWGTQVDDFYIDPRMH